jgi:hypothetical protein
MHRYCNEVFFNKPIQGSLETEYGCCSDSACCRYKEEQARPDGRSKLKPNDASVHPWNHLHPLRPDAAASSPSTAFSLSWIDTRQAIGLPRHWSPIYPLMSIIPLCFFLLIIQFIISAYGYFAGAKALEKHNQQDDPAR